MKSRRANIPDIKFRQGDSAGFTSSSTTSFGVKAPIIIRELIQNSLDAAREARRNIARIRFEIKSKPIKDIPGLETYKQALKKAVKDQKEVLGGELPDHANLLTELSEGRYKKVQPGRRSWVLKRTL